MTKAEQEEIRQLTERLLELTGNARQGLPEQLFLFVSQLTPLVNVDLLIRNTQGQTLLTWRADRFYGPGWHVPGGIVRFKETIAQRITAVAHGEVGSAVTATPAPLMMREVTAPHRDVRGHFISLLYACTLDGPPDATLKFQHGEPKNGQWMWHDHCPDDLIAVHEMYRSCIDGTDN